MSDPVVDELLAAVAHQPDEREPYHVLADYWSDHGDPRGAWIASQLGHGPRSILAPTERAYLDRHAQTLLGRFRWWLDDFSDAHGKAITWRWGFVHQLTLITQERPVAEALDAAFALPATRALRRLTLNSPPTECNEVLGLVAKADVRLQALSVQLGGSTPVPQWSSVLARSDWPLQRLDVEVHRSPREVERLDALLESPLLPRLEVLQLTGFHLDVVFERIGADRWHSLFGHLEALRIDEQWRDRPFGPRLAEHLGNVAYAPYVRTWDPRTARRRDYRSFDPEIRCGVCGTLLRIARFDHGALVCSVCHRSFAPPGGNHGQPRPPEDF